MNLDLEVNYLLYFRSLTMEGEEEGYANLQESIKKSLLFIKKKTCICQATEWLSAKRDLMGMPGVGLFLGNYAILTPLNLCFYMSSRPGRFLV